MEKPIYCKVVQLVCRTHLYCFVYYMAFFKILFLLYLNWVIWSRIKKLINVFFILKSLLLFAISLQTLKIRKSNLMLSSYTAQQTRSGLRQHYFQFLKKRKLWSAVFTTEISYLESLLEKIWQTVFTRAGKPLLWYHDISLEANIVIMKWIWL